MKSKVIPNDTNTKRRFFLLMIAPLLIGLMISLTTFVHAGWNDQDDPLLSHSPKEQGWHPYSVSNKQPSDNPSI